ncbi:hypothetical protein a10_03585 [Streptomyces acidiscabies]|nr:hypothetical protein a10_03585 [Streptomyces acidiscabies]GAV42098.1 hypothetical protein Saa2_05020 [Streptomyces acidiscabies]
MPNGGARGGCVAGAAPLWLVAQFPAPLKDMRLAVGNMHPGGRSGAPC